MRSNFLITFAALSIACDVAPSTSQRHFALDGAGPDMSSDMSPDMPPNQPPVASDDLAQVDEDSSVDIDVLANDVDPDGDPLTVYVIRTATEGTVTVLGGGRFVYEPRRNFNGPDEFTYGLLDGHGGSATAKVLVNVEPVNDAPRFIAPTPAQFATLNVVTGQTLEFTVAAGDIDEDSLTFGFEPFTVRSDSPTFVEDTFRWTPGSDDVGSHAVRIFVDDGTVREHRDLTVDVGPLADQMCGQYRCDGDAVCFRSSCFEACMSNEDCEADEACFDGRCAATSCSGWSCGGEETCVEGGCFRACANDAECTPGERCFGGRCATSACDGVVCAEDSVCVSGSCRVACESSDDCGGLNCFVGGCAPDVCTGVVCPSGQSCANGVCSHECQGDACGADGGLGGDTGPRFEAGGCGCSSTDSPDATALVLLFGAYFWWRRRRLPVQRAPR